MPVRNNIPDRMYRAKAARAKYAALAAAFALFGLEARGPGRSFTIAAHAGTISSAAVLLADEPEALEVLLSRLNDATAPDAERSHAAADLIRQADNPAVSAALEKFLEAPLAGTGAGAYLLTQISFLPDPAPGLFSLVSRRFQNATADELPRLLAAVGAFRSRAAARLALTYTTGDADADTARAAFDALEHLSARDDPASDHDEWSAWLAQADALSEMEWQTSLVRALAAQSDRERTKQRDAIARLNEIYRKLHLATPAAERSALLADMLKDRMPEVRDLGFELIQRELSETGRLDQRVGAAAVELLADPQPKVRAMAAVLVRQIAPDGAGDAVVLALDKESDPKAASDLLLAATRWPSKDCVFAVLKWLERDSDAQPAAVEACLRFARAGELSTDAQSRVLRFVRSPPPDSLPPAGVALLIELGNDDDRRASAALLVSASPPVRAAAADNLLWYPDFRERILSAAEQYDDLMPAAAKAVMVHTPDAAQFERVMKLRSVSPEISRSALLAIARVLPVRDLVQCIGFAQSDQVLRAGLLASLTSPTRVMSEGTTPENLAAIATGVVLTITDDLAKGDAAGALGMLDSAPYLDAAADKATISALRVTALLATGKIEEATKFDAPLSAYLRGFDLSKTASHAGGVARLIIEKLPGPLFSLKPITVPPASLPLPVNEVTT